MGLAPDDGRVPVGPLSGGSMGRPRSPDQCVSAPCICHRHGHSWTLPSSWNRAQGPVWVPRMKQSPGGGRGGWEPSAGARRVQLSTWGENPVWRRPPAHGRSRCLCCCPTPGSQVLRGFGPPGSLALKVMGPKSNDSCPYNTWGRDGPRGRVPGMIQELEEAGKTVPCSLWRECCPADTSVSDPWPPAPGDTPPLSGAPCDSPWSP